jgi:hypothetical protein
MKRTISNKFLIAANFLLLASGVKAINYYVSPSGNDNNDGTTIATAWKTISKVNSRNIAPGSNILFEGGAVFTGGITIDANDANDPANMVTFSSYGTGKAKISSGGSVGFYAFNTKGFIVSNLIFEGAGMQNNSTDGVYLYNDLSGNVRLNKIELKSLEITNYGKTGLLLHSAKGNSGFKDVLIDGLHVYNIRQDGIVTRGFTSQSHTGWSHQNITIRNTELNNITGYSDPSTHRGSGIILGQVDNGLVEKSVAHHNGAGNTHCGGPGGIWTWDSNNITIQYCESYSNSGGSGCDGLGFDLDGGVTNSVLQYNYSHDNDGAGYLLGQYDYARPWANNIVRYNISENDGRTNGGGITLFKGPGTTMGGVKIYNNTIYTSPSSSNSGVGAFKFTEWNTGITGVEVYNNIFQSTGGAYLVYVPTGYNATFSGNLYWSSGGTFKIYDGNTFYNSLTSWRNATSNELTGSIGTGVSANPNLLNAGNGGTVFPNPVTQLNAYKIGAGSAAIDAGQNLVSSFNINIGSHDFFNNALAGTIADIGAHEAAESLTTGIENTNSKEGAISFYPNPVASGSEITVKGAELPFSAEIISVTGARVWKESKIETKEYAIPTAGMAAGPYFLLIEDNVGHKKVNKVIIQ